LERSAWSSTHALRTACRDRACSLRPPLCSRISRGAAARFHRIIPDFMIQARRAPAASSARLHVLTPLRPGIQGGDPTGTGRGGESIYGEKFEDEITRVRGSLGRR
jgi:hypothetical protein